MLIKLSLNKRIKVLWSIWSILTTFLTPNNIHLTQLNPKTNDKTLHSMGGTRLKFRIKTGSYNNINLHTYPGRTDKFIFAFAPVLSHSLIETWPKHFTPHNNLQLRLNSISSNQGINSLPNSQSLENNGMGNRITKLNAFEIIESIKLGARSISSTLKEVFIDPLEEGKFDRFNSYTAICLEQAKIAGYQLDEAIMNKFNRSVINLSLLGLPIAIKDNICTEGLATTAGSRILENYIPNYDATVVKLLKAAGAIIIGKTNMDEFGMGTGSNFVKMVTRNPLNSTLSPGGSSSGSAATVGGGELRVSLGSDTGGSLRLPAAWCGCVGFRPSYGRVSRYGLIPYSSTMDVIGPIAQSVEEAGLIYSIIAGPDQKDKTTVPFEKLNHSFDISPFKSKISEEKPLKGYRVGILDDSSLKLVSTEIGTWFNKATMTLHNLGAELIKINLGFNLHQLSDIYYTIALSEALSNLARYDGILYGPSSKPCNLQLKSMNNSNQIFEENRTHLLSKITKLRLLLGGLFVHKSIEPSGSLFNHSSFLRTYFKDYIHKKFEFIDVIITPTTPTLPKLLNDTESDMWNNDIFLTFASLSNLPAISIPHINHPKAQPYSLQIVGNYLKENDLLGVAFIIENYLKEI